MFSTASVAKKITLALLALLATVALVASAVLIIQKDDSAGAVKASDFNPGRIIDDAVFYNAGAMTASQIQTFLNAKNPYCDTNGTGRATDWGRPDITRATLASYIRNGTHGYNKNINFHAPPYTCLKDFKQDTPQVAAASGLCEAIPARSSRTAAQIIHDVAQACGINPQVFLVLLEKEQSLVTDIWPLNLQYQRATGFACPDNVGGACDPSFNGFFRQVYAAGRQFKLYQSRPNDYNYRAGVTNNIFWQTNGGNFVSDGRAASRRNGQCGYSRVHIENQATAALYIYTPYRPNQAAMANFPGTGDACSAYGNRNFWFMFNGWFGSTHKEPDLSLVQCEDGKYLIEKATNGRRRFVPEAVANEWFLDTSNFIDSGYGCDLPKFDEDLSSLVRSRNTGDVYFIHQGGSYRIADQKIADAWNIGSISATLPQMEGKNLKQLTVLDKQGLTLVAHSDNPSRKAHYMMVDGDRYTIAGTTESDNSVWRMITGDTIISSRQLPASVFQRLNPTSTIDYAFSVGANNYVFDHGKIRRVTSPDTLALTQPSAIPLPATVLSYYQDQRTLDNAFERPDYFYYADDDLSITRTTNNAVLKNLTPSPPQPITRLLTNKLIDTVNSIKTVEQIQGNIRLIECANEKYLVERNIRRKRHITVDAITQWGFSDKHFFLNDRGCDYPTYDTELDSLIRSRNTGRVYYVHDSIAYLVHNQQIADEWEFGNTSEGVYPQFNPASIHDNLSVIRTLPSPDNI